MQQLKTLSDLKNFQKSIKGKTLSFVPTMGALHAGHIALVEEGLKQADICLPYIYINPTQFAAHEDLDQYPRTLEADLAKLENAGAQAVWLPSTTDIYPNGTKTDVHIDGITEELEGEFRPHFFDGVTTVVARMFRLAKPDIALFGEKDFQQLQVIKKMTHELDFPIQIIGVPTQRDKNGLALSSRNAYLSEEQYEIAIELNKILVQLAQNMVTEKQATQLLLNCGFDKVDYCVQRNSETFGAENPNRVLAAVHLGKTRLIDNMPM